MPRPLNWTELLPPGSAQKPAVATAPQHDYLSGENGPGVQQDLRFDVNPTLDNQRVRLPGFIVPLEVDNAGNVREFLLVPYVGACIHVPPPPPNQIVYVRVSKPIAPVSMTSAFWVTGALHVAVTRNSLASTAYTLLAERVELYSDSHNSPDEKKP
jgi:uncharacterized protein